MDWKAFLVPVATAFLGFLLGLAADPLKRFILTTQQTREARQRLYDDLGTYLGRVEALSLLNRLDLLLWHEVITPQVPNFDYYSTHEAGVLLRADTNRGVYLIVERLRALGSAYREMNPILSNGQTDDNLPETFLGDVLYRYQELLASKRLNRRLLLKACKLRRQPIGSARPPLLS